MCGLMRYRRPRHYPEVGWLSKLNPSAMAELVRGLMEDVPVAVTNFEAEADHMSGVVTRISRDTPGDWPCSGSRLE